MEKLKPILIGVVALLAATVVYGYVGGGSSDSPAPTPGEGSSVAAEAPRPTPEAEEGQGDASPDSTGEKSRSSGPAGKESGRERSGGGSAAEDKTEKPDDQRGGQNSRDASEGTAPAKSEFVASVDAICRKLPSRFAARAQKAAARAGKQDAEEIEDVYRQAIVRTLAETAREIDALTPPAGDEQEVAALVAAMEKATGRIEQRRVDALTESSVMTEFAKRAKRYGLTRCSQF